MMRCTVADPRESNETISGLCRLPPDDVSWCTVREEKQPGTCSMDTGEHMKEATQTRTLQHSTLTCNKQNTFSLQ